MYIDSPIQSIGRISPAYQKRLLKLGIKNLRDIFFHFPRRYDDFSNIVPIAQLCLNETATIQGRIAEIKNIKTWRKRIYITEAFVQDSTGTIRAVWFNQPFLADTLKEDSLVSLSGKVSLDDDLYFSNPAYEKLTTNYKLQTTNQLRHTGRLVPVYPETAGLSSRYLRYLIQIFSPNISQIKDWLPPEIKKSQRLLDIDVALRQIHFPASTKAIQQARRRLAFDELFLIQLFTLKQKLNWQKESSLKISFNEPLIKDFVASLPFKLTDAQRRSAWEILQDLAKTRPMNRLLEGDVGSGKTVVAAIAALEAAQSDLQVALMAPTEILAQQHFKTITNLLAGQNITIGLLTGSEAVVIDNTNPLSPSLREGNPPPLGGVGGDFKKLKKLNLLESISSGQIKILIGTHALIQEKVSFDKLALVILDEQHRFGVEQRAALQKLVVNMEDGSKTSIPHLLSMTATPIPRSLALTIYGDLDISILDEMPVGRQKIITEIIAPQNRQRTYEFIRQEIKQGQQVFVICPRIEIANNHELATNDTDIREIRGSFVDISDVKAVKEEYKKLSQKIFPDLKIGMLHGKMKPKEKDQIMRNFKDGQTDILVSTSVVEVGIDIPNATVMMIEGAERFGLAQLHQFRGRVGRGAHQSHCFLFTESSSAKTSQRLKAMISAKNGFELAEKDLAIRGPGEFFGTRQSGLPDLSMASLADIDLIKQVRLEAIKLLQKDPALKNYPLLGQELKKFQKTIHLE
ncbi:ATP-dependent DNA helicase RecG [Patescibacteria group bacterium]|nr:ATP-dependent DNA helicase RecG [Patescibacteria group bacterium]